MDHTTVDPTKLFSVKGIVAVITGGGTGIGLMMTKTLASNGAKKVYIIGRRADKLSAAVAATSVNGNVVPLVGDVTSKESLQALAEQIKNEVGYINLLICNSGYYPPRLDVKGLRERNASLEEFAEKAMAQDPEDWNLGFATNTTAVAFTAFAFLKLLGEGNKPENMFTPGVKSQILVTTSIAGYIRNTECYNLSKAATTHLIKSLGVNLVPYSIRMNGIAPGLFPTDLAAGLFDENMGDPSVEGAFPKSFVPAERLGGTSDMAGFLLYVASQAGAYLNMNVMVLDGGRMSLVPSSY